MGKPLTQVPPQRAGNLPGEIKSVDTVRGFLNSNW